MSNTTDKGGPKERAYDEHMEPLIRQIIALAKGHKINILFHAELDGDLCTRTCIPADPSLAFNMKAAEFRYITAGKAEPIKPKGKKP